MHARDMTVRSFHVGLTEESQMAAEQQISHFGGRFQECKAAGRPSDVPEYERRRIWKIFETQNRSENR